MKVDLIDVLYYECTGKLPTKDIKERLKKKVEESDKVQNEGELNEPEKKGIDI